jgi:hypothetical protein
LQQPGASQHQQQAAAAAAEAAAEAAAIEPDGLLLLAAGGEGGVLLWRVDRLAQVTPLCALPGEGDCSCRAAGTRATPQLALRSTFELLGSTRWTGVVIMLQAHKGPWRW